MFAYESAHRSRDHERACAFPLRGVLGPVLRRSVDVSIDRPRRYEERFCQTIVVDAYQVRVEGGHGHSPNGREDCLLYAGNQRREVRIRRKSFDHVRDLASREPYSNEGC